MKGAAECDKVAKAALQAGFGGFQRVAAGKDHGIFKDCCVWLV